MRFISFMLLFLSMKLHASQVCQFELYGTDSMRYTDSSHKPIKEIVVPQKCSKFKILFKYDKKGKLPSQVMGHNFILTKTTNLKQASQICLEAGQQNHYIPKEANEIIVVSSKILLGGGKDDAKEETICIDTRRLDPIENYTFFCSFPGHLKMMRGILKLEKKVKK